MRDLRSRSSASVRGTAKRPDRVPVLIFNADLASTRSVEGQQADRHPTKESNKKMIWVPQNSRYHGQMGSWEVTSCRGVTATSQFRRVSSRTPPTTVLHELADYLFRRPYFSAQALAGS